MGRLSERAGRLAHVLKKSPGVIRGFFSFGTNERLKLSPALEPDDDLDPIDLVAFERRRQLFDNDLC